MFIDVVTRAPGAVLVRVGGSVDRPGIRRLRDQIERLLDPAGRPVRALQIDLSAVDRCHIGALVVLDDARRSLLAARSRFAVHGLDPAKLTSFTDAGLIELFAAYRASRHLTRTAWPREAGGREVRGSFDTADGRLARICLDLATVRRTPGGGVDVAAVTGCLVDLCARRLGVDAAVVLVGTGGRPGRWAVAAASTEGARRLVVAGLTAQQGPVAECLRHGGPVSVPDVAEQTQRWPRYVSTALSHGVLAARALPLRPATRSQPSEPIGVLALFSSTAGPMAAADLVLAQAFADLAAVALGSGAAPPAPERSGGEVVGRTTAAPEQQVLIEQAVGVICEQEGVGTADARDLLDGYARSRDLHPSEVARAILAGTLDPGRIPPATPPAALSPDRTPP